MQQVEEDLEQVKKALLTDGEVNLGKQRDCCYVVYHCYGLSVDKSVVKYYVDSQCKVVEKCFTYWTYKSLDIAINKLVRALLLYGCKLLTA